MVELGNVVHVGVRSELVLFSNVAPCTVRKRNRQYSGYVYNSCNTMGFIYFSDMVELGDVVHVTVLNIPYLGFEPHIAKLYQK